MSKNEQDASKKPKMGRPKKPVNWDEFDKLCAMQCTEIEISQWFGMCEDTLNLRCKEQYEGRTFSDVCTEKRGVGKISLRRAMFQKAVVDKNPTMQIWLSKNYLGMADKQETAITADNGITFQLNYKIDEAKSGE